MSTKQQNTPKQTTTEQIKQKKKSLPFKLEDASSVPEIRRKNGGSKYDEIIESFVSAKAKVQRLSVESDKETISLANAIRTRIKEREEDIDVLVREGIIFLKKK